MEEINDMPVCEEKHAQHLNLEETLNLMPSDDSFIEAATIFGQLCDSTRLKILYMLRISGDAFDMLL